MRDDNKHGISFTYVACSCTEFIRSELALIQGTAKICIWIAKEFQKELLLREFKASQISPPHWQNCQTENVLACKDWIYLFLPTSLFRMNKLLGAQRKLFMDTDRKLSIFPAEFEKKKQTLKLGRSIFECLDILSMQNLN